MIKEDFNITSNARNASEYASKASVQKLLAVKSMKAKGLQRKAEVIIRKEITMVKNLVIVKLISWIRKKAGDADGAGKYIRKRNRC